MRIEKQIAQELDIQISYIKVVVELLDEGNTIPFIARYRKEKTGEMNETVLQEVAERLQYLRHLEGRKLEVIRLIEEQGKLTEELHKQIENAAQLQQVEDYYRPFRPKRKTRASIARDKGLEPFALWIQKNPLKDPNSYKEVLDLDPDEALQGALDIIAEQIADDAAIRKLVRNWLEKNAVICTKVKNEETNSVYEMYYAYQEPIKTVPPHRILAMNRGEKEDILKVSLDIADMSPILQQIEKRIFSQGCHVHVKEMIEDAYKRLLFPSIEREIRNHLTEKAEQQAIKIFSVNLRQLLLQPPVLGKRILGVDPAYRTGCKWAVIDTTGKMLEVGVVYPTKPHLKIKEAKDTFAKLVQTYDIAVIAIGNGTASRETEQFVAEFIQTQQVSLHYVIVNEAGASIYSASKVAQKEFPDLDVSERSAISIARRLLDPLAELVKIDPQSIGVGQYQHDVSQKQLTQHLGFVVSSAVNHVGVDVNTASASLLAYVSGINQTLANNIVQYRENQGKLKNRKQLKEVPRLGDKAYEQCAGFLRIYQGENPLDYTAIHPESYKVVERLLAKLSLTYEEVMNEAGKEKLREIDPNHLAQDLEIGVPTLKDILENLLRPGRDPREALPKPIFRTDILSIEEVKPGMQFQGTVRNILDFGAFVDIGLKNDGLIHISQMSDKFIKHPLDMVSIGDTVTVWILSVDLAREKVSLTMKKALT